MTINISKLRKDLMDRYGTAMHSGFPMAVMDLSKIERMSDQEIIEYALSKDVDLKKYEKQ